VVVVVVVADVVPLLGGGIGIETVIVDGVLLVTMIASGVEIEVGKESAIAGDDDLLPAILTTTNTTKIFMKMNTNMPAVAAADTTPLLPEVHPLAAVTVLKSIPMALLAQLHILLRLQQEIITTPPLNQVIQLLLRLRRIILLQARIHHHTRRMAHLTAADPEQEADTTDGS